MHAVNLFLVIGLVQKPVLSLGDNEPVCTSRFDYDHKMLQKMVMLEMEQSKIKQKMEEQISVIRTLEKSLDDEKSKRQEILKNIAKIPYKSEDETGATYIRWGRTTCPGNMTELVYKGYAGGSHYTSQGAASSYLCLPEDPLWSVYEDAEQTAGTVYGAEYELLDRNMNNFFGKTLSNEDVPCCVCHARRNSVMMIPARNQCYDGWTLEYQGYLTGGHYGHHATDFVCLDGEPETMVGGSEDKNGKLFYFIEARCGSLRCPPYVNGRELTCAVCSK